MVGPDVSARKSHEGRQLIAKKVSGYRGGSSRTLVVSKFRGAIFES